MKLKDLLAQSTVDTPIVRCWEEDVLLPTYETGEFEKNPIFLEKRVYQGHRCGSLSCEKRRTV